MCADGRGGVGAQGEVEGAGEFFGARGAVPASGNIAPALCAEIYNAFQRGDHEAAKAAQLRLNPIRMSLNLGTAPGGVKAALDEANDVEQMIIHPIIQKKRQHMLKAHKQAQVEKTEELAQ